MQSSDAIAFVTLADKRCRPHLRLFVVVVVAGAGGVAVAADTAVIVFAVAVFAV